MTDVCDYADDTIFHDYDLDLKSYITKLEHDAVLATEWFESNYMKLNQDKCHFLFSGHKYETLFVNEGKTKIWESKQQKLLGILIDRVWNSMNMYFRNAKKQVKSSLPWLR